MRSAMRNLYSNNIPVSYEPNEEMERKYCGKNADTQKRFELLVKRIAEHVK